MATAGALAVAGVAIAGSSGRHRAIGAPGPVPPSAPPPRPPAYAMKLVAYSSCADLLHGLRQHTADNVEQLGSGEVYMADSTEKQAGGAVPAPSAGSGAAGSGAAAPGAPAPGASAPDHSSTNVHEAGADEPDVVKTDGRRIVTVSHGMLRVVDAATRKITGSVRVLERGAGPDNAWLPSTNLLLSGDRALVVVPANYETMVADKPVGGGYPGLPQASTRFVLVDLAGAPKVLGSVAVDGSYVDGRLVGSTARLVTRSQPQIKFPQRPRVVTPQQQQRQARDAVGKAPLSA
ncbi:MAG TPA: beta-propeller domain-containing protein, partial [Jatrophihabitantaceae bacterium]